MARPFQFKRKGTLTWDERGCDPPVGWALRYSDEAGDHVHVIAAPAHARLSELVAAVRTLTQLPAIELEAFHDGESLGRIQLRDGEARFGTDLEALESERRVRSDARRELAERKARLGVQHPKFYAFKVQGTIEWLDSPDDPKLSGWWARWNDGSVDHAVPIDAPPEIHMPGLAFALSLALRNAGLDLLKLELTVNRKGQQYGRIQRVDGYMQYGQEIIDRERAAASRKTHQANPPWWSDRKPARKEII